MPFRLPPVMTQAKTGDYTILVGDCGVIFTNRGAAGAVNFTLPTTSGIATGWHCWIYVVADQNVTITAPTADTMVGFNDQGLDSLAWSTAGQRVGSGAHCVWDGTGWLTMLMPGSTSGAQTVATVTLTS